jgi:carbon-monoxide dehydrogenase large subunit
MTGYIGKPIPRLEDRRLLTGQGSYSDDLQLEGQVYCVFLRSPHAHARLIRIDAAEAQRVSGVLSILTGADYAGDGLRPLEHMPNPLDAIDVSKRAFIAPAGQRIADIPQWPLALDRVRHVGEIVAAVVAESAAAARDAAELIEVEYEPLPAAVSPPAALAPGASQLHQEAPGNVCFSLDLGDPAATASAFARASVVVRHDFVNQRIANCQMEPRSALGDYDAATGRHTLFSGTQGVVRVQHSLAAAFDVPVDQVRVVSRDVGGGFGPRTFLYPEQAVVVWASRRLRRPVKWTSDRSEGFISDYQARDSIMRAALALDAQGRILGYEIELLGNVGAHTLSYVPMSNCRNILTTGYQVPAVRLQVRAVLTNTVPTAPYRGAGRPEAHHALERLLDMAARRLSMDRVEIRRRNLIAREQLPYRSPMGLLYDSGDFHGYMERVLTLADWAGFARRKQQAHARGRLAGIGLANYVESPVGAPRERVAVTVWPDDSIEVIVGTQSTGQGHETSYAQVLADQLGVGLEQVRLRYGDTDWVKVGGGTHSDRSMRLAGTLLVRASQQVIEQGRVAAAARLEVAPADLEFKRGAYRVEGTDREISLFQLARAEPALSLSASCDIAERIPAYPAGAAVCEVEIDPETGSLEITRYTTVDDVGQVINPLIVDGQTHGGIVQGLGQALHEQVAFDPETGQLLSGSFMDYGLSRAGDVPNFRTELMEDPTAGNPLRVKGGGEGGIVPATAAVVNAVCDALAAQGIEDLAMPLSPHRLWRAINSNDDAQGSTRCSI